MNPTVPLGMAAALFAVLAAASGASSADECPWAVIDREPIQIDPQTQVTGSGSYPVPRDGDAFQAHIKFHERVVSRKDGCTSSVEQDVSATLLAKREGGALELSESWTTGPSSWAVTGCPHPSLPGSTLPDFHHEMPGGTGSHPPFRLEEKVGAQADVILPPPMKAGIRFTWRLHPTIASLTEELAKCSVTSDLPARATAAAGGRTTDIQCDEGSGRTLLGSNRILLQAGQTRCRMLSQLVQELSNAAQRAEFETLFAEAKRGEVSRDSFIERVEMTEFLGVRLRVSAKEKCGPEWACLSGDLAYWQTTPDFARYFDGLKRNNPGHLEDYGKEWDAKYKPDYEKVHGRK